MVEKKKKREETGLARAMVRYFNWTAGLTFARAFTVFHGINLLMCPYRTGGGGPPYSVLETALHLTPSPTTHGVAFYSDVIFYYNIYIIRIIVLRYII